jgi:hypothetical protein
MQKGRYCHLNGIEEVTELQAGMDFRLPQYRREVFMRFYEFHLRYKAHAGAVYYAIPFIISRYNLDMEQRLWFAFINGCTQNIITTNIIFQRFPDLLLLDIQELERYFQSHYSQFGWDTDRRYHKSNFIDCVRSYRASLGGGSQVDVMDRLTVTGDPFQTFRNYWEHTRTKLLSFGRLSTFSYLEYLRLVGVQLDCPELFIDDLSGSRSHRNGVCKVLGRDDIDWWKQPEHPYDKEGIAWLTDEAALLLSEAKARIDHPDVSYFTLETTLCCYKSWHRPNRRYPNVYNDMFFERIIYAMQKWQTREVGEIWWECRRLSLPKHLLLEANRNDKGLHPIKQNHYRLTGEVIMMDREYPCFKNRYNDRHSK